MKKRPALILGTAAAIALALAGCSAEIAAAPPATTSATTSPTITSTPTVTASAAPSVVADAPVTPITMTVGDTVIEATLNDSQVSQDFLATLPASLPFFRNGSIEYISEFAAPLTETGPFYTDVQPGDLVYYNPADSITIIYEETSSVPTLTLMGQVTSDLSVFEDLPDDITLDVARAN